MNKRLTIFISIGLVLLLIFVGTVLIMNNNMKKNEKLRDDDIQYVDSNFNINLIKTVNLNKNGNYLISPYSIEMALNLLKEGANNETLSEIESVIGNRNISDITIKNRVSIANAAFIKNEYKGNIKKDFYNRIKEKYHSEILYDDFKTPKVINDWVNDKTNGMIDRVLDKIDPNYVLGLANALAIDVEWDGPFNCGDTRSQQFNKVDGSKINVAMMHKTLKHSTYKYLRNDSTTGVIIPYKLYNVNSGEVDYANGRGLEFMAILPDGSVSDYINNLTETELANLEASAKEVNADFEIKLALPRFKYDYTLANFKEVLNKLGIHRAFDSGQADFTRIMERNSSGNLFVGEAIHKTHIDLSEKGTKAAAVTYFGMYTSGMQKEVESVSITFDKPFIYIIRDKKSKEMLFFGVVYEPNKWTGSTCSE